MLSAFKHKSYRPLKVARLSQSKLLHSVAVNFHAKQFPNLVGTLTHNPLRATQLIPIAKAITCKKIECQIQGALFLHMLNQILVQLQIPCTVLL